MLIDLTLTDRRKRLKDYRFEILNYELNGAFAYFYLPGGEVFVIRADRLFEAYVRPEEVVHQRLEDHKTGPRASDARGTRRRT